MKKPVIAIDIDDVLAQGTNALRLLVNQKIGVSLTQEDYSIPGEYWGYYENIWKQHGIAELIDFDELNHQMTLDQSHVPIFDDSHSALESISRNYELCVLTARDETWEVATRKWIDINFPGIFNEVYLAGGKKYGISKGEFCKNIGAEWLIDDNLDHAHSAAERGIKVILFGDYGWHIGREIPPSFVKCRNWKEVQEYFDAQSHG